MASGLSVRYGRNKLLEKVGGREVILHTVMSAGKAGLSPVTVTRNEKVRSLLQKNGYKCILHNRPLKSDTMHIGIESFEGDPEGYLFMQGDQPLILPETLIKLVTSFLEEPDKIIRLGYNGVKGSPVIFPASMKEVLLSYEGDRGGMEAVKHVNALCRTQEAAYEWEMWDVDTPESMAKVRAVCAANYERRA